MARLPQPGADSGKWGEILNEYLSVSHATDGTLKVDTVGAPQLKPNSVTHAALAPNAVSKADIGLGNVDNTSDASKPISVATQTALDAKVSTSSVGAANGVAALDGSSKVLEVNIPTRLGVSELNTTIQSVVDAALANLPKYPAILNVTGYRNNRIGAVGDSITAFDGSASTFGSTGGAYHAAAAAFSQGRMVWAGARATGGNTVEQIVDGRIPDFIAANFNAGICVVLAGTNSVTEVSLLSGQARIDRLTQLIAKLNAGYDALAQAGSRPVAASIPVRSNAAATEAAGLEWNALVKANAAARGLDFVDFYSVVAASQGVWKTNYNLPGDDVHPSPTGHKAMGLALAQVLYPQLPSRTVQLATVAADPDDLLTGKGLFATDTLSNAQNTPSDGISDGWQSFSGAGVTFSRTQDAFGIWWQRITVPASASGGGLLQVNLNGSVAIGDRVRIAARIRTGGLDLLSPNNTGPASGVNVVVRGSAGNVASFGAPSLRADYVREGLIEQEYTIPSNANGNLQVNLQLGKPPTGAADVWAEFAQVIVTNKTARKLL